MPNDLIEAENELNGVLQEKRRVQEHIDALQQDINENEAWLALNHSGTGDSQERLEELLALQAYVAELRAQMASLEEVALELMLAREYWQNPEVRMAS
jgi:hypothetical protein